jgi:ankyrin repeat protein
MSFYDYPEDFSEDDYVPFSEIHMVIIRSDYDTLRELLEQDFEQVNLRNLSGFTPLHLATIKNDETSAKLLIQYGADVNNRAQNNDVYNDISDEVADLVEELDYIGKTPLHIAMEQDSLELVELLLENGASPEIPTSDGEYPIHLASQIHDSEDFVLTLIDHGVNINRRDEHGNTALHYAVLNGNDVMIEVLLESGADVNIQNNYGKTPLHLYVGLN